MIKEFFKQHESFLQDNYPGLSLRRLENELDSLGKEELHAAFSQILCGTPLEYITNKSFFYKSEFFVDERVLIPRSESEILVEYCAEFLKDNKKQGMSILEVGVGSGALIISLLQELSFTVKAFATDLSSKALEVAKKNHYLHQYRIHPETKLEFIECDRLEGVPLEDKFDLIMTNPPYIKNDGDLGLVHKNVLKYEPHMALFLEDKQYSGWFEKLFIDSLACLSDEGLFMMEGHEHHLSFLREMAKDIGFFHVEVVKDYTGRDRFLKGRKKQWIS
jgi:release factor glutamine methyltransferase